MHLIWASKNTKEVDHSPYQSLAISVTTGVGKGQQTSMCIISEFYTHPHNMEIMCVCISVSTDMNVKSRAMKNERS